MLGKLFKPQFQTYPITINQNAALSEHRIGQKFLTCGVDLEFSLKLLCMRSLVKFGFEHSICRKKVYDMKIHFNYFIFPFISLNYVFLFIV